MKTIKNIEKVKTNTAKYTRNISETSYYYFLQF